MCALTGAGHPVVGDGREVTLGVVVVREDVVKAILWTTHGHKNMAHSFIFCNKTHGNDYRVHILEITHGNTYRVITSAVCFL